MSSDVSRRSFLTTGTAATTGALAAGVFAGAAPDEKRPARIRLGIIGCGGIMNYHVRGLCERKESVQFRYLCDVDPRQIDVIASPIGKFQKEAPKRTGRFEHVLEDRHVDAVIIATPHQWHAPIALRALAAGKDVYCEKPLSHVFSEGPLVVAAAKTHKRVLQHGSQMRSSPVTKLAGKLLKDGIIGDVKVARAWTAEVRNVVRPVPDSDVPKGVDYDRWLGPAPKRPFNRLRFHRTWRFFRDYANGEIGDDGIHDIDMARWGLGVTTHPRQIAARGGHMLHGHVADYPDNMHATYEYPDGHLLVYENYPFTSYGLYGFDNGNVFYGPKGYMIFSRRGYFQVYLGKKEKKGPRVPREIRGNRGRGYKEHMADFLKCIRTREQPEASPQKAHLSCTLVHLGEAAFRSKSVLDFDPKTERITNNPAATKLLTKTYRKPYGLPEGG
ncbi:MAG: Gfo/Idh/MocA family protein [Planctomycetaceae bacterium]